MAPHSEPSASKDAGSVAPAPANLQEPRTGDREGSIGTIARGNAPRPPTFQDKYAERQYQKERLALGFRIFAKLGFDEGVAGHITLRVCISYSLSKVQFSRSFYLK